MKEQLSQKGKIFEDQQCCLEEICETGEPGFT
jgi:hypothetical protein